MVRNILFPILCVLSLQNKLHTCKINGLFVRVKSCLESITAQQGMFTCPIEFLSILYPNQIIKKKFNSFFSDLYPRNLSHKDHQTFFDLRLPVYDSFERMSGYFYFGIVDFDEFLIPSQNRSIKQLLVRITKVNCLNIMSTSPCNAI